MFWFVLNTGATEARGMRWICWRNEQLSRQELIYTKALSLYVAALLQ